MEWPSQSFIKEKELFRIMEFIYERDAYPVMPLTQIMQNFCLCICVLFI